MLPLFSHLWGWLKANCRELAVLAIMLAVLLLAPYVIQWISPTAGILDTGAVLALLQLGVTRLIVALFAVLVVIGVFFPTVDGWLNNGGFKQDFENADPARRLTFFLILILTLLTISAVCVVSA